MAATMVRTIFAQPSADEVWAQHPRVADHLDQVASEILTSTGFPKAHWKQVWSNNPQEHLNGEIRRRTNVVGIFPTRDSIVRLIGALLAEQHDEWQVAEHRYLSKRSMALIDQNDQTDQHKEVNPSNQPQLPAA